MESEKEIIKESEFLDFYNSRTYNANCFNADGTLNKNYNSLHYYLFHTSLYLN